jgi:prolyl-tRNA synthetase
MADESGFIWPESISPFKVHLLALGGSDDVATAADEAYKQLQEIGVEVLYDDRDTHPGDKFGDSDLIGIPTQLVVGNKTIDKDGFEITDRSKADAQPESVSLDEVIKRIS